MTARRALLILALAACAAPRAGERPASAEAPRVLYDFESGVQGFAPLEVKEGQIAAAGGMVTVTREKAVVRSGDGSLSFAYAVEPRVLRALTAEARLPRGIQSARFWVRSSVQTMLVFSLRETDGSSYQLGFHVPAHEWTLVTANVDELRLDDGGQDENGRLDLDQVSAIGIMDLANLLASAGADLAKLLPIVVGPRQLWLDDLEFSPVRAAQNTGMVGDSAYLVDNFEAGPVRWLPARIVFADQVLFDLFPQAARLKILPEAAGPGTAGTPLDPGGKGLRFTYTRGEKEAFALVMSLEGAPLARAHRLRMSLNASQKSFLVVQVKEKDDSEYQHAIMPDDSVGWRNLDLPLAELTLAENSKDENNALDPGQIKEITILDGSALLGLPGGETHLELDAVSFALR